LEQDCLVLTNIDTVDIQGVRCIFEDYRSIGCGLELVDQNNLLKLIESV